MVETMTGNNIFVFGSNPEGRHGWGASVLAMKKFGAIGGKGRGLMGNSYALITKNLKAGYKEYETGYIYETEGGKSVPKEWIVENISELYMLANARPELKFFIAFTANSFNRNGYSSNEMIEMFVKDFEVPQNIRFHNSFRPILQQMGYI